MIGNHPDIFQDLHWKLGASKEVDRLSSADAAISLEVGGFEQRQVVGLSIKSIDININININNIVRCVISVVVVECSEFCKPK